MNSSKAIALPKLPVGLVAQDCQRTGSRVICNPAPTDTDEDWIILVKTVEGSLINKLTPEQRDADDQSGDGLFVSVKEDNINLIITEDEDFYQRFNAATSVARDFNLTRKADRIKLFQAVLYGNYRM